VIIERDEMRAMKLVLLALFFLGAGASASPDLPQAGKEYVVLNNPQQVPDSPSKTEVIEFFMYHCPACNAFEPTLSGWVAARDPGILFRRVHIPHAAENDPEAHLFLALDAMQKEVALHDKVMRTWHVERHRLATDADNAEWAVKNGIDRQQFRSYYDSFSVQAKLRSLPRYVSAYGVESTPTIVIGGRYLTNPAMVAAANRDIPSQNVGAATLKVMDALLALARKDKH
jgi:thiol:disulfide interchange protein DsbA